ncbi:MAG: hypothetical protein JO126_00315 [Alphaproteobacteria bacterium]|nr:hypothetical protein [Alphaproteobacteria bacterium]MBV8547884.1 hypothetical protein [Alphaproteobacteria bacterium]
MIRTTSALLWFGLIIAASVGLYRTSDHVQELDRHLRSVNAEIDAEQESIHVLNAEWSYLTNPARIEGLAKRHLALRPSTTTQIASIDHLLDTLPTRSDALAHVAVNSTPIANVTAPLPPAPHITPTKVVELQRESVEHEQPQKSLKTASALKLAVADNAPYGSHMNMQRTASAAPTPDTIGALLDRLDSNQ